MAVARVLDKGTVAAFSPTGSDRAAARARTKIRQAIGEVPEGTLGLLPLLQLRQQAEVARDHHGVRLGRHWFRRRVGPRNDRRDSEGPRDDRRETVLSVRCGTPPSGSGRDAAQQVKWH